MARDPFGGFVAGLGPNMRRNIGNSIAGNANPMAPGFGGTAKRPNASGVPFVGAGNPMTQSGQMGTMNNFNMTPMPRGGAAPMQRPAVNKPPMNGGGAPPQWMPGDGGGQTNPNIPGPPIGAGGPNPMGGGNGKGGTGTTVPQGYNGPPVGAGGPNPMVGVPSGSTGGADPYAGTGGGLPPVGGNGKGGTGTTVPQTGGNGKGNTGQTVPQGYNGPPVGAGGPNPMTPTTGGGDPYAGTGGGSPVYQPPGTGGLDPLPNTPTTGGGLPPANPLNKGGGGGRGNPFQPSLTQFGQRPALPPMRQMQRSGPAAGDTYGSPNSGIDSGGSWNFNEGRPSYEQGGAQAQYGGRNDFYSSGNSGGAGYTSGGGFGSGPQGEYTDYEYSGWSGNGGGPGFTQDYANGTNNPVSRSTLVEGQPPTMYKDMFDPSFYQAPQQFAYTPFGVPIPGQKPAIPAFYGPPATPYKGKGVGGPIGPSVGRGTPGRGSYGNTPAGLALGNGVIDRGQIGYGGLYSPTTGYEWNSDPYNAGGNGSIGGGFANAGYGTPSYEVNPVTAWNENNSAQREGFSYGGYGMNDPGAQGNNGGGKVVCTAMNEAYGFGSFRQAIWLKHSAGLDPAYQRGYHAMFVPLLRFARGGQSWPRRLTWRALQHIARHRTADIWLQSKGAKRDALGRVYRALLEPLCFVVGKIRR